MKFRSEQYPSLIVHFGDEFVQFSDHEFETTDGDVIDALKRTPGVDAEASKRSRRPAAKPAAKAAADKGDE